LGYIEVIPRCGEVMLQKRIVEVDVVRDKYARGKQPVYAPGYFLKWRAISYEFIGDPRKGLDSQRYRPMGVDERRIAVDNPLSVVDKDSNLGDAAARRVATRGFNIHDGVLWRCAGQLHRTKIQLKRRTC